MMVCIWENEDSRCSVPMHCSDINTLRFAQCQIGIRTINSVLYLRATGVVKSVYDHIKKVRYFLVYQSLYLYHVLCFAYPVMLRYIRCEMKWYTKCDDERNDTKCDGENLHLSSAACEGVTTARRLVFTCPIEVGVWVCKPLHGTRLPVHLVSFICGGKVQMYGWGKGEQGERRGTTMKGGSRTARTAVKNMKASGVKMSILSKSEHIMWYSTIRKIVSDVFFL